MLITLCISQLLTVESKWPPKSQYRVRQLSEQMCRSLAPEISSSCILGVKEVAEFLTRMKQQEMLLTSQHWADNLVPFEFSAAQCSQEQTWSTDTTYRCWCLCLGMAKQQHADILLYITTTAYTVQEHLSLCVAWRNNCTVFYYFVPQHALTLKGK